MDKIKGVNLGGWFVLEQWMKPSLFKDINSNDETGFSTLKPNAKEELIKHWETFITKDDFVFLKNVGINSVRLPVPWWLEGNPPYFSALPYIKRAMKWATEVGLNVLIDLHTAPGCQNGFDNGGIQNVMEWHLDQKNIDLTVDRLEFITKTFIDEPSFWGIQVLNEPFKTIDMKIIQDFYKDAYTKIRAITDKPIVFHDAFRPTDSSWEPFFKSNEMKNVIFDVHLYHVFDHGLIHGTMDMHIDRIINDRIPMIREINKFIPVIVGEWSLGLKFDTLQKDNSFNEDLYTRLMAYLQLYAYTQGYGYYFWNYKVDNETHDQWHFRKLVDQGIFPSKF
ncbi:MAG: cellulase family glycosylhydrolase [Tenericutes bacterium]|nr:cellulase family glycosylhydrolase [Mycoplasmatota bacterium]